MANATETKKQRLKHLSQELRELTAADFLEVAHLIGYLSAVQFKGVPGIVDVPIKTKGIVEQTNLLALNAAIETARAGESGNH